MPEVVVRRRLARRTGGAKYRANRWFYRNRPRIAVTLAFLAAAIAGLVFAAYAMQRLNTTPADPEPAASAAG